MLELSCLLWLASSVGSFNIFSLFVYQKDKKKKKKKTRLVAIEHR